MCGKKIVHSDNVGKNVEYIYAITHWHSKYNKGQPWNTFKALCYLQPKSEVVGASDGGGAWGWIRVFDDIWDGFVMMIHSVMLLKPCSLFNTRTDHSDAQNNTRANETRPRWRLCADIGEWRKHNAQMMAKKRQERGVVWLRGILKEGKEVVRVRRMTKEWRTERC